MRIPPAAQSRLGNDDGGFTLIETIVVTVLSGMIGAVVLAVVTVGMHQQVLTQQRNTAQTSIRTALQRLVRDLAGADPLLAASSTSVTVQEDPPTGSSLTGRTVTYSVVNSGSTAELVVDETDATSSGSTQQPQRVLLSGLVTSSTPVFAFAERPPPYTAARGVGADCSLPSGSATFDPGCVGSVTVTLSIQPGSLTQPVTVSDPDVELRNAG